MLLDIALLILRVVLGLLFVGHGTQKLFGWFGGHGLAGTEKMSTGLGMKPARLWAMVVALSETLGGLGLVFGFLTPIAAALIIGVMIVAIIKVHWPKGIWNMQGGFEYPLMNIASALVIGLVGPGLYSLDALLRIPFPLPLAFFIALIVVILGVIASLLSGLFIFDQEPGGQRTNE